jgi:hypothetical protein
MAGRPHFISELVRRAPLGPALQLIGVIALIYIWFKLKPGVVSDPSFKVVAIIGFLAFSIGLPLTHRAAFRLQRERQARDAARTSAPWDTQP